MVTPRPPHVSVDLRHGGRWTSLRMGGREWLWHRDEPRRPHVVPDDPFADAGGLEECVPTVRGRPDHGSAWSRAWRDVGDGSAEAHCGDFTLRRRIVLGEGRVSARYRLSADPGYRFVWAAHALLDVSAGATLRVPGSPSVRLYPEAAAVASAFAGRPWPPGAPFVTAAWPGPDGLRLDRLGPDDGTAVGAIVVGCAGVTVRDGGGPGLRMRLNAGAVPPRPSAVPASVAVAPPALPVSVALWRNLGGFPDDRPYRSIGVEPMLGSVFDLAEATEPGDAVTVPASGSVEWELEIEMAVDTEAAA